MQTALKQANNFLRQGEYESAIKLYEQALEETPELARYIEFSIRSVARRRIAFFNASLNIKEGQRVAFSTRAQQTELEKPDDLDDFFFDLIKKSGLFDQSWYLDQYRDKYGIIGNPLSHYLTHGVTLSTNPSPGFDTAWYLKTNPDVAAADIHPFLHYVCQGHKEGRLPKPPLVQGDLEAYYVEPARYVPRLPVDAPPVEKAARVIAFYLPQFHPIPENDAWWGEGFTEWTNVRPARPLFEGHYQPHVPDDFLGYYDLRDTSVMRKQIELARQYGIEGFCFYVYWFSGKRLLETPVDNYLADPSLDLPFCICWANENWTRRWDGSEHEILMAQEYTEAHDLEFIADMAKYLRDPRYIRVDGKPLFIVYRPKLFPDMKATAKRWREWCRSNGIGEIYLAYTQSFECVDPAIYGFDAAVEFPPNNSSPPNITSRVKPAVDDFQSTVYDWRVFVERSKNYKLPEYKLFRGVNPSWDNTARRKKKGSILLHSSPCGYQEWLYNAIIDTRQRFAKPDERLVFINAWNEWAEGAHLEPDQRYGYAYLEATRMAQVRAAPPAPAITDTLAIVIHAFYEDIFAEIMERLRKIKGVPFKLFITTPHAQGEKIDAALKSSGFAYHLLPVNNHGRDVLPFLKIAGRVMDEGYAYILKIHTKKSKHREDGDVWRNDLYDKLLNENSMRMAMSRFNSTPNLGMIGPSGHIVPMNFYWGSNAQTVESLACRLGQTLDEIKALNFVAGNMFFARMAALAPLLNLAIDDADFEPEAGQLDGTLAHALERAVSISLKAGSFEMTDTEMNQVKHSTANYRFASK